MASSTFSLLGEFLAGVTISPAVENMHSDCACDDGRASTRRASPLTPWRSFGATDVRVLAVSYYCCCRTLCVIQDVGTRCISPVSLLCMPSYSAENLYPTISAKISARLPDIKYTSDRPIYRKISIPIHNPTFFPFFFFRFVCVYSEHGTAGELGAVAGVSGCWRVERGLQGARSPFSWLGVACASRHEGSMNGLCLAS